MSKIEVKAPEIAKLQEQLGKVVSGEITGEKALEIENEAKNYLDQLNSHAESKMVFDQNQRNEKQFTAKEIAGAYMVEKFFGNGSGFSTKAGQMVQKAVSSVGRFTEEASNAIDKELEQQLIIAPLFRSIEVAAKSLDIPVADEDTSLSVRQTASGRYNVSSSDTANTATKVQNTFTNVQLTPHKFTAASWLSRDEEEDYVFPVMDFLVEGATQRLARSIDKSLLRGDGAITTANNAPAGYNSVITGVVSLAEAVAGDGLKVFTGANNSLASAGDIANARAAMGKYAFPNPRDLVYITNTDGYNQLVQSTDFVSYEKAGPLMTLGNGMVGAVWGIPVLVSEFMDSVSSTTSNQAVGVLMYKPKFVIGRRRGIVFEKDYDAATQVTDLFLTTRWDMKALTTVGSGALSNAYSLATVIHSGNGSI